MSEAKPRRGAVISLPIELIARLIDLPEDVSIRTLWGDTASQSIKVRLESDVRFHPIPVGQEARPIYPTVEIRLMPAPPFTEDEPQRKPEPDDVLWARFILDLPAPDEGATE